MEVMRTNRLVFAFFAAAILFSMVREWSVPASCLRMDPVPSAATQGKR